MTGAGAQFWLDSKRYPTASDVPVADIQAAIERAGARWRAITGQPPTHICLPPEADPAALKLWTLQVLAKRGQAGVVVVGRDGKTPGA